MEGLSLSSASSTLASFLLFLAILRCALPCLLLFFNYGSSVCLYWICCRWSNVALQ